MDAFDVETGRRARAHARHVVIDSLGESEMQQRGDLALGQGRGCDWARPVAACSAPRPRLRLGESGSAALRVCELRFGVYGMQLGAWRTV